MNRHTSRVLVTIAAIFVTRVVEAGDIYLENHSAITWQYRLGDPASATWGDVQTLASGDTHRVSWSKPLWISFKNGSHNKVYRIGPDQTYRFTQDRSSDGELLRVPPTDSGSERQQHKGARDHAQSDGQPSTVAHPRAKEPKPIVRKLIVLAVADDSYRRCFRSGWENRIRGIIGNASPYFEQAFGISVQLTECRVWPYNWRDAAAADSVIPELWKISPGEADVVIGFVAFRGQIKAIEGETVYFSQHLVVSDANDYHPNRAVQVLVHELAHVFGAFHVNDRTSVMQLTIDDIPIQLDSHKKPVLSFGRIPTLVIKLTFDVDLHQGIESLNDDVKSTLQQFYQLYGHRKDQAESDPVTSAYIYLARRAEMAGDKERAT
jgi:hypothetical protein